MGTRGGFRGTKIPQTEKDYVIANYGHMNLEQIARDLGYFKDGKPNKEKVKAIVRNNSTASQREEFERRFEKSGLRKQGARFQSRQNDIDDDDAPSVKLPQPPSDPESGKEFLWGEFLNDYWFFPPRVKKIGTGKSAFYCTYRPKWDAQTQINGSKHSDTMDRRDMEYCARMYYGRFRLRQLLHVSRFDEWITI